MATCGSLESREVFSACIKDCKGDAETLQAIFLDTAGNEPDKKSILEQAFRDVLHEMIQSSKGAGVMEYTDLVLLSIDSAQLGICYHTVPTILLSDILDCVTLDVCEKVFEFVENQVSTWTQPDFYSSGKILLLRMCNDLLRRLSSTQNTVFCGRIQLFLARLFPLSEKSALNLMSHFNLENVTTYNKSAGMGEGKEGEGVKDEEAMEVETLDDGLKKLGAPIDYNLYHKLWSLQDFFLKPTQCYVPELWKTLTTNVQEVLQAFSSYKLEDVTGSSGKRKKKKKDQQRQSTRPVEYSESHYFAKFLTSEKLLNLQLRDCHFRRHVLIELLILFQYLTSDVKFKSPSQVISDAQSLWIKETTDKVYELIEETPPNGAEFASYIKQVLKREENWIAWKNDGCPSYEKVPLSKEELDPYPRRPHLGDRFAQASRRIDLGNPELSRLWNLCPDNLEACRKDRKFVPQMEKFLEEPMEQADPDARIEAEFKVINNPNFAWQALRLLSQSSPHFFQNTAAQIRPLPEYLEHVIVQTGKELQ